MQLWEGEVKPFDFAQDERAAELRYASTRCRKVTLTRLDISK